MPNTQGSQTLRVHPHLQQELFHHHFQVLFNSKGEESWNLGKVVGSNSWGHFCSLFSCCRNGFGEVKQELYSPSTYSAPTGLSQSQGMPMTSQNNAQFLDQAVPASSYFSAPPTTPYAGPYQSGTPQDMSYYHEPVGTSPPPPPQYTFKPLTYHWFYRQDVKGKVTWKSFSSSDSAAMEKAFLEGLCALAKHS